MANRFKLKINSKKLFYWLRYVFCVLAILLSIDYVFFCLYKTKIIPPNLSQDVSHNQKLTKLQVMLGRLNFDKKSNYINFEQKKPPNVIRIGCFGDSFTRGDEVNDRYDYPSFLQDLFQRHGYDQVEVMNFGMGWHGFHQAFILWKYVGQQYGIDAVLLGPKSFHRKRDSSFNHSFAYSSEKGDISYFHSRYILKDRTVERIDPIGETVAERANNYWKFIPHLQYLKYDANPPAFLTAPVAYLLPNRKWKSNPFYYQKDRNRELDAIYRILLSEISDQTAQVFFGDYNDDNVKLAGSIGKDNLVSAQFYQPVHFPYLAFANHNSSCGNALLAQQMFDFLTNKEESVLSLIETEDIDRGMIEQVPLKKMSLSEYMDIAIEIDGVKLGRFYDSEAFWEMYCKGPSCEMEKNTFEHTVSLIMLKNAKDESMLDAVFVPVDFEISEETSVTMKVTRYLRTTEFPLGRLKLLNPGLNIGEIDLGSVHLNFLKKTIEIEGNDFLQKSPGSIKEGDTVGIFVNNVLILSGRAEKQNEKLQLSFLNQRYVTIRADGREFVDIEQLDSMGVVYLALYTRQGEIIKIPFARWLKVYKKVPLTQGKPRFHDFFESNK